MPAPNSLLKKKQREGEKVGARCAIAVVGLMRTPLSPLERRAREKTATPPHGTANTATHLRLSACRVSAPP
nr:hypothetical protein Itr_chr11CG15710 [Ipomoea trifida]GLL39713.1 hypothetical protein Itr_chr11CG15720 [Ipomoea trifida]